MSDGYGYSQWTCLTDQIDKFIKRNTNTYFHYTTLANCINMLKANRDNGNNFFSMWASHFLFLNDSEEYFDGLNILTKALKDFTAPKKDGNYKCDKIVRKTCKKYINAFSTKPIIFANKYPAHYIISFCSKGNLLSQWKCYGKDSGIAIEYDLNNCLFDGYTTWCKTACVQHFAYDVIYNKRDKENVVKEAIQRLEHINTNFEYDTISIINQTCALISFMKSHYFKEEAESRLLFAPLYNDDIPKSPDNDPMKLVKYRETNGKIKPYLPIILRHKDEGCLPIKSLTVGPGRNQCLIFNALIMLVQSNFPQGCIDMAEQTDDDGCRYVVVNGIRIRTSTIPYRE